MSDALRAIKEEMGPDAVILSTREIKKKGGQFGVMETPVIEVMAAADSTPPPAAGQAPLRPGIFQHLLKEMALAGRFSAEIAPIQEELRAIRESLGTIKTMSEENEKQFSRLQKTYDEMKELLQKGLEGSGKEAAKPQETRAPIPPRTVNPVPTRETGAAAVETKLKQRPPSFNGLPPPGHRQPRVISVTSGKGGVGKTNVVANLAVALSSFGQRVLILDADLALGNLDVLFGIVPKYSLTDVLNGEKTLSEIMVKGPRGIQILPTSSGTEDLTHLTSEQKLTLLSALDQLEQEVDIFLIDTGAGISANVLFFSTAAQEIVIVAAPEPTSLTDAYAVMKVLSKQHGEKRFRLLVNMVKNEGEAKEVYRKLCLVSEQFLDISIDYIGSIPNDDYVKMAVCQQKAVVDIYPRAKSSVEFTRLAKNVMQWPIHTVPKGGIQFLWKGLLAPAYTPAPPLFEKGGGRGH